jgi:hypothetical protein
MKKLFSVCFRYQINDFTGGSLLRIEPVRKKREDSEFECVAENGVGDPVSAKATLEVYDGKYLFSQWVQKIVLIRAFRTRPIRRTRTQTEISDSDSGSDLRNRDFPTP